MLDGLREGLATGTTDVIADEPRLEIPKGTKDPLKLDISTLLKSRNINRLLKLYPKAQIIVFMLELPKDIKNLDLLKKFLKQPEKSLKIALLDCNIAYHKKLFESKFISAAVCPNPEKKYSEDSPSADLNKTFDMRYLLVTSENYSQISAKHPFKIFRSPPSQK